MLACDVHAVKEKERDGVPTATT